MRKNLLPFIIPILLFIDISQANLETNYEMPLDHRSKKTVLLFLVDGLSYRTLEEQFKANKLPTLRHYFLNKNNQLLKAHSVFPSLTYPNMASILKEKPVHLTEAIGNKILFKDKFINFNSIKDRHIFSGFMKDDNIFTRLNESNSFSLSLDYGLGVDASQYSELDLPSAYAASQLDYDYLDFNKISELNSVLLTTKSKSWPEFIFVHLVGVDSLSHRYGASSTQVKLYLKKLDSELKKTFDLLKKEESNHKIISLLTSDHGFNFQKTKFLNVEALLSKNKPDVKVVSEARFANVYFLSEPVENDLIKVARQLLLNTQIEMIVYKKTHKIHFLTRNSEFSIEEQFTGLCALDSVELSINKSVSFCSDKIPAELTNQIYPFLIENLASFFHAKKAPDLLVIPNSRTVFIRFEKGSHGGPTEDETIVPLLMRNARLQDPKVIMPLWQLLKFMN